MGNTKRIAKNTLILYARSLLVMVITLYTSRVILKILGVEDYGLFNVVGGVVSLFTFLKSSMTKCTQRFLNVEMAKEGGDLASVFKVSLTIHLLFALLALLLAETIGLWFLNHYIQIPSGREVAANYVFHATVISLVLTIITTPYNACVVAHEKMGFYALVSIADAVLRLVICFLLASFGSDKLIVYSYLLTSVAGINLLLYCLFCFKKFPESKFGILFDKKLFKDILGYASWTIVGQSAIIGTNQGNNILVNMFHSVTSNAAMGVASQVNGAVVNLTSNFQTAFNPQITKSYAAGDYKYLKKLVYSTSKISYYCLFLISVPLMFNIELVLNIWLEIVPQYSSIFCILILWNSILNALSSPLNFCVLSSGDIKSFQITTAFIYLSDLVILYFLFKAGFPPYTALVVKIAIMVAVLYVRLHYASKMVSTISVISYLKEVLIPITLTSLISILISSVVLHFINGAYLSLFVSVLILPLIAYVIYLIGIDSFERSQLKKVFHR